jgi:PAS domain S-box-containing protein
MCLDELGYDAVGSVASADDAVSRAGQLRPALVLMDIQLKGKTDGIDAAKLIRERFSIPTVFLTGLGDEETVQRAKTAEPFGYLVKPFVGRELRSTIETALHRHSAETRLNGSHEKLSVLLQATTDAFIEMAPDGRILEINEEGCRLTGYAASELKLMKLPQLIVDKQLAEFKTLLRGAKSAGSVHFDCRLLRRDGREIDAKLNLCSSPSSERVFGFLRDVTERKHSEEKLRQLSRAVEQSPATIVITDAKGRIEYVNPRFAETTGYAMSEAIGQNPRILKSGEQPPEFYAKLWETLSAGQVWHGEFQNRRKDGRLYWEQASISPVRDSQGRITHYIAIKEEITQQKRREMELMQSKAELQQVNAQLLVAIARERELAVAAEAANRAKSLFLASMSHELRTPLNVINGTAALLAAETEDSETAQSATTILASGETLLGIIAEILDYTSLQVGQLKLEVKPFELLAVVSRAVRLASETTRGKPVELTYRVSPRVPALVQGDARRLQQIIVNLLQNALKFTAVGRVHLSVAARPLSDGQCQLNFTVVDTGIGIDHADFARLFQPFSQANGEIHKRFGGTGLGLAISRSFASRMGGDIAVRSVPGRGSAFRCSIVLPAPNPRESALAKLAPPELRGRHLLALVSNALTRRFLAAIASAWGMRLTLRSGREDAAVAPGAYDFALVDPALAGSLQAGIMPIIWLGHPNGPASPFGAVLPLPLDPAELSRALAHSHARSSGTGASPLGAAGKPHKSKLAERLPLRILAADDIRTNREMVRRLLAHLGYTPELVENGAEVLAAVRRQPFDLLLLDVQMPVMDGLAAAREIVCTYPDRAERPRIVAITANALPEDRDTCLAAGMDDYLSKPVLPADLEACILRQFGPAYREKPAQPAAQASPSAAELPWIDTAHLGKVLPDMGPAEAAEALRQMYSAALGDYRDIWPRVSEACARRESARFAELTHGLKGCFKMLGWTRIAERCTEALGQARRNEFSDWDSFPEELQRMFNSSSNEMTRYLDSLASIVDSSETPPMKANGTNG